ncbi:acyltransferase family protein [Paraburkholderia hospita]|jgi:peptidoglycan/LPS O-acetylase OafA/YrhL|uniref:acyltransferase family protein n=1 Tax=Paraburkholderia hospita TaxID=169430 RepID=UPI000B347988|nr:acyltransferase [Paraburkholderia hospita]AXE98713.1 acyltransferase [Paraburkholderia hospita]OUL87226.1 acyltransferase [Paraburkholderia hospita]
MKRLDSVQVLRAVAALLVVFCHAAAEVGHHSPPASQLWPLINTKGLFGVDIFFVVSGFVMMYIISGQRSGSTTARWFIGDRIVRVVPLYWAATLLSIAIGLALPALKNKNCYEVAYVLRSLFFVPSTNPLTGAPEPVLGLGWTLNFEMFFYAVISLVLLLGIRRVYLAVVAIFVTLVTLGLVMKPEYLFLRGWTHTIILEFVFGVVFAQLRLSGFRIGALAQVALIVAGVTGWLLTGPSTDGTFDMRGLMWGPPAAAIFAGVVMGRRDIQYPKLLLLIGDASYSLYLTHLFIMRGSSLLVDHLPVGPVLRVVLFFAVFIPCAVGFAILSYRKFEMPTMRLGRRLLRARPGKASPVEGVSAGTRQART